MTPHRPLLLPLALIGLLCAPAARSADSHDDPANSEGGSEATEATAWSCSELVSSRIKLDLAGKMALKAKKFSKEETERYGKDGAREELVKRAALKNLARVEFRPVPEGVNLIVDGNDLELKFNEAQQIDLGFGPLTLQADRGAGGAIVVRTTGNDDLGLEFSPAAQTLSARVHVSYRHVSFGAASLELRCSAADADGVEPNAPKTVPPKDQQLDDDLKQTSVSLSGYESMPMQVTRDAHGQLRVNGGLRLTYDPQIKKYYKLCESRGYNPNFPERPHPSSKWRCRLNAREYEQVTEHGKWRIAGIRLHPDDQVSRNVCTEGVSYRWLPDERRILCTQGCRGRFLYILEQNAK